VNIVVLGYIVRGPLGGLAWHHLQYCIGLRDLGHDVLFIEDSDDYASCYDPLRHVMTEDPTYGLAFAHETFSQHSLGDGWAYYDQHTARWLGPGAETAVRKCRNADILLNLSGVNPSRSWLDTVPVRALIDTDPVFTQIKCLTDARFRALIDWHNVHFTFVEFIGTDAARTPDDGIHWVHTRQPVALDCWDWDVGPRNAAFTTVMQWQSYKPQQYDGVTYGMKAESFSDIEELPRATLATLEIALGGEVAPRDRLTELGWRLVDPLAVTRTTQGYQDYLHRSKGEFSVAKQGYVAGRSGWFSERSAAYLASGRPVITQDTGFTDVIETGCGLLAYETCEQAVQAIDTVIGDYPRHCEAARHIAEMYFDANRVLEDLLDQI
jgi:hypothetical protein